MTSPQLLAQRLRDHGVKRFFGIPGGPSIPYMEAFRKVGIEFILTSHESAAAVMADVTARLTGITGVCHATFGPGATNLSTGIGGAFLDRSPVLALTSEMPDRWLKRTAQMNIDHQALFRPLTKATFRMSAENAAEVIDRSLRIANDEYPGPVHIGLPSDIAEAELEQWNVRPESIVKRVTKAAERARVLLASSRRPLIAVGLTAMRQDLGRDLAGFLENRNIPVVFTPMARGLLPSYHRSYAGVLFHALSDRINKLTSKADLVIGLGYDPVEYNYESWMPDVPLVHFDTVKTEMPHAGAIQVISSPRAWFEAMRDLRGSEEMMTLAGEVRTSIRKDVTELSNRFTPVTVVSTLNDVLPRDAIVTADVGSHLHLLGQLLDLSEPGKLIMTNGWSSMGFGLPAANAAAMCRPEIPVVCITGDGGFMMSAGEIMTARRNGLKVIVVVLADRELNLIKVKEEWKGIKQYGTKLYSGSLFASGSFLGIRVVRVDSGYGMQNALREALISEKSTIIEAAVDPAAYSKLVVRG